MQQLCAQASIPASLLTQQRRRLALVTVSNDDRAELCVVDGTVLLHLDNAWSRLHIPEPVIHLVVMEGSFVTEAGDPSLWYDSSILLFLGESGRVHYARLHTPSGDAPWRAIVRQLPGQCGPVRDCTVLFLDDLAFLYEDGTVEVFSERPLVMQRVAARPATDFFAGWSRHPMIELPEPLAYFARTDSDNVRGVGVSGMLYDNLCYTSMPGETALRGQWMPPFIPTAVRASDEGGWLLRDRTGCWHRTGGRPKRDVPYSLTKHPRAPPGSDIVYHLLDRAEWWTLYRRPDGQLGIRGRTVELRDGPAIHRDYCVVESALVGRLAWGGAVLIRTTDGYLYRLHIRDGDNRAWVTWSLSLPTGAVPVIGATGPGE